MRSLLLAATLVACGNNAAPPSPPRIEKVAPNAAPLLVSGPSLFDLIPATAVAAPQRVQPTAVSTCGDGRVGVSGYERICAPCMPGHACTCGNAPTGTEECDGADLAGQSCESLGYVAGALSCSRSCTLDASNCQRVVPDRGSREVALQGRVDGTAFAMAFARNAVWLASTQAGGPTVRFGGFDVTTGALRSSSELSLPTYVPPGPADISRLQNLLPDSLGEPVLAATTNGWVIAARRYQHVSDVVTFHVGADGKLAGPMASLSPGDVRFVVAGATQWLVGIALGGLQLARVDATGGDAGRVPPFPAPNVVGNQAGAAIAWKDGWSVVSNTLFQDGLKLEDAFVSGDGKLSPPTEIMRLPNGPARTILVGDGDRRVVIFQSNEGPQALVLGTPGARPIRLGPAPAGVIAASLAGDVLTLWVSAMHGPGVSLYRATVSLDGRSNGAVEVYRGPGGIAAVLGAPDRLFLFTNGAHAQVLYELH
jgi:hypothetical protein